MTLDKNVTQSMHWGMNKAARHFDNNIYGHTFYIAFWFEIQ